MRVGFSYGSFKTKTLYGRRERYRRLRILDVHVVISRKTSLYRVVRFQRMAFGLTMQLSVTIRNATGIGRRRYIKRQFMLGPNLLLRDRHIFVTKSSKIFHKILYCRRKTECQIKVKRVVSYLYIHFQIKKKKKTVRIKRRITVIIRFSGF